MKKIHGVDETEYANENWEEHTIRTANEALAYSKKNGMLSNEQVELNMAKAKYDALKKTPKAA